MKFSHVRLFCSDLDGTLLGSSMSAARFTTAWEGLPAQRRPLLVYNTERSVADTLALVSSRRLPDPDFIIGSIGTELHDSLYNHAVDFPRQFEHAWDLARIDEVVTSAARVRRRPGQAPSAHRSSWTWDGASSEEVLELRQRLEATGLQTTVVYSCRHFLDIIPAVAGKGPALAWLCRRLGVSLVNVLVAGDAGNDRGMFLLPGVNGIVVANALPELFTDIAGLQVFTACAPLADGLLEGLEHFGVLISQPAGERSFSLDTKSPPRQR